MLWEKCHIFRNILINPHRFFIYESNEPYNMSYLKSDKKILPPSRASPAFRRNAAGRMENSMEITARPTQQTRLTTNSWTRFWRKWDKFLRTNISILEETKVNYTLPLVRGHTVRGQSAADWLKSRDQRVSTVILANSVAPNTQKFGKIIRDYETSTLIERRFWKKIN